MRKYFVAKFEPNNQITVSIFVHVSKYFESYCEPKGDEPVVNKQVGITIFTVVEVITLVVWLVVALIADSVLESIIAALVLIVGFTVEHLITFNIIHKRPLFDFRGIPVGQKAVVSLIEMAIWIVWLILARMTIFDGYDDLVAAVVLAGLLIIEHTLSDNVFTQKRLFERLADKRTVGFSIVEAAGAAIWLALVEIGFGVIGVAVLAAASFIEHNMAVNLALRDEEKNSAKKQV